jgi:hypothetical protein
VTRSLRKPKPTRAWWLFAFAAYALIASWGWQLGLVELFEHHDEAAEACPDDDGGPCDCGDNCHCCLLCAHQTPAAVTPAPAEVPEIILGVVELDSLTVQRVPPSADATRVPKVPKRLS